MEVEEQKRVVDKLEQACQKHGIGLQPDKKRIGYGDSIRAYMNELAAGRYVVLVLSKPYSESDYCMYELREIYNNQDFRKRVYPIVISGTQFHEPVDRVPYIKHWEEKKAKLEKELTTIGREYTRNLNAAVDDYANFRQLMDELLSILADMNTLTEDIHVGTDFEALLDRIKPSQPPGTPAIPRKREPDRDFRQKIGVEIQQILNQRSNLQIAMAEATAIGKGNSGNLVETLCQTELETALDDVLRPATQKCLSALDVNSREFADKRPRNPCLAG